MRKVLVPVFMTPNQDGQLRRLAFKKGVSQDTLVRSAIKAWLKKNRKKSRKTK